MIAALGGAAACMTGPENGTSVTGNVAGKTFTFQGFYNEQNAFVRLEVLKEPGLDPSSSGSWTQFGSATTGTAPTIVNGDTGHPLYYWSTSAAPVPAFPSATQAKRWPQNGVTRVRAVHPNADGSLRILNTFDSVTFDDCFATELNAGSTWMTIGQKCNGVGHGTVALTSEPVNAPVAAGDPSNFGGFLGRKGEVTAPVTDLYYFVTNAPQTLTGFKTKYGFPGGEVKAVYYNDGDLGLGREMHCKTFFNGLGIGVACFVSNFSGVANAQGVGVPAFGIDPNVVLADAVAGAHPFATVAMVYDPPAANPNSVKFIVYDAAGNRSPTAVLDSTGNNTSVPNNCLSCHGINSFFDPSNLAVSNKAEFLPFDPFSFRYSTQAGFQFDDQEDEIRRLNAMIRLADPTPASAQFIDGLYAPKSVNDATAVAHDDFVPDGWENANGSLDGTAIYRGVVKVGCRTCHMSANSANLDFADPDDFSNLIGTIATDVCGSSHIMPHAEHVAKRFWKSGARGYLISAYAPFSPVPNDPLAACKP
jgi:hypothetical protein